MLAVSLLALALLLRPQEGARPNVVVLIADDLGRRDISRHGGRTPTPNIDRLFAQGVELLRSTVDADVSRRQALRARDDFESPPVRL